MIMAANDACWECRRRRLVCDRTLPECRKCQTRSFPCPGYYAKPLRWLQPQQVKSKVRPKRGQGSDSSSHPSCVPSSLPDENMAVFEAVEYYNARICPDLVASGVGGSASPFFMPPSAVASVPRACIESLICTALCHRLLQSTDRPASQKAVLSTKLHRHRGEAIRQLTGSLAKPDEQTSDTTLASVLTFLLVEIQQSFSPDWQQHSDGATAIITIRGGLGELVFARPLLRDLLRYYVIVDVMGCTTSPNVSLTTAARQLELINLLPVLYGNGLASCLPCPPELFVYIIRINHLRAQFRATSHSAACDRHTAAMDILRRIRAYAVDVWAMDVSTGTGTLAGWLSMARIYQCSVAIYGIATLLHDTAQESEAGKVITSVGRSCQDMLVRQLRSIQPNTQLRKLVIWPLVVAGIRAEDNDTREFVLAELAWISKSVGIAAPLLGREFLQSQVWPLPGRRWEMLFDRPYLFVV